MSRPRKLAPVEEPLGKTCHVWDHAKRCCREEVEVLRLSGKAAVHFVAKLAIDADGSPWAYHPFDVRPPDNTAKAYDWLANIDRKYLNGIQGKDATGPAPGFYVSATSLVNPRFSDPKDTRRYVDAGHVPYIVLPTGLPTPEGMALPLGSLAWVVDLQTGRATGAIFAETGKAVGEGSVALARRLGLNPIRPHNPPKVKGFDERRFLHIVFPGEVVPPPWPVEVIHARALQLFTEWGGWPVLHTLRPGVPEEASAASTAPGAKSNPVRPAKPTALIRQVIFGALRLRKKPAFDPANVLTVLPHGHLVEVIEQLEESVWWKVRTHLEKGRSTGYVHSKYLGPPARKRQPPE